MPRIVRIHETGSADVLRIEEAPVQEPGEGEVRIRVEALGLNRAEVLFRMGRYLEAPELPTRLGYEASGVVDAVGPGVTDVAVGDRVGTIPSFSMNRYGVYGEQAVVPAASVAATPEGLSAEEGASIWMQYLTAYGALVEYGGLAAGDAVVIPAASSSVGLAAIQMVKAAGAIAIATTRGPDKKPFLLEAGADQVVVTEDENLVEAVMATTDGKGARLAFDPVAGPMLPALADAAAHGATIVEYGALSPEPTPYPLFPALSKGLTIRGYTLFELVSNPGAKARGIQYVHDGIASGALRPVIDRTFPFDDIADAHRYMESNRQKGKIVVTV